jgi:hypothetical protein
VSVTNTPARITSSSGVTAAVASSSGSVRHGLNLPIVYLAASDLLVLASID